MYFETVYLGTYLLNIFICHKSGKIIELKNFRLTKIVIRIKIASSITPNGLYNPDRSMSCPAMLLVFYHKL